MRISKYIYQKLGQIAETIEEHRGRPYYEDADTHNSQFVGRIPANSDEFATALSANGFEKIGDGFEESWSRSVGDVFYDGERVETGDSGYTYVYAHTEIKPSLAPLRHLRNDSVNGSVGVKRMKKFLDENGLAYEPIRP